MIVLVASAPSLAQDEFEPNPSLARLSADDAYARRSARSLRTAGFDSYSAIGLDDMGRVLVGGTTFDTPRVVRLDGDGQLDPTFGSAGVAELPTIEYGWWRQPRLSLEVDGAGRIVVIAAYQDSYDPDWRSRAVRLLADGALDPAFAAGGVLDPDPANGPQLFGPVHAAGGDGAMLALAAKPSATPGPTGRFDTIYGLVRISADGTIDTEYGGGFAQVGPWYAPESVSVADFAVDFEGRAVVAVQGERDGYFDVTRFDATGAVDTDFRVSAGARWESETTFPATQVALDGTGRIVALNEFGLRRRLRDGAPDPAFSGDGYARRYEAAGFEGGVLNYAERIYGASRYAIYPSRWIAGLLAVATGADRWAIATPATSRRAGYYSEAHAILGVRLVPGIRIQAIDPDDPGAIITATCRSPRGCGRGIGVAGLAITSDGTTAYALGGGFVGRVDLTARKALPLPDLSVQWIGFPRAVDLGGGRYRVTARVRIRNASRRAVRMVRSGVTLEFFSDVPPLEIPPRRDSGQWRPFRVRRGASVVRRFRWEGGGPTTNLAGARLSIEVAGELPDVNFADNVATSEPMTPVAR